MADLSPLARDSVDAQAIMFVRLEKEEGLGLHDLRKRMPENHRIPFSTLKGWANGTQMPAWALGALGRAGVPEHLLSLVLDPFDRHVGLNEEGEGDFDDAALAGQELAASVQRARHPNSPGGMAIVHTERAEIIPLARKACAKARRAAA
jgi:hypothetical protein